MMIQTGFEEKIKIQLREISELIDQSFQNEEEIGVFSGLSGLALFQFYYAKFKNDNTIADRGEKLIIEIIQRINNEYNFPTYCSGIAGAGWVLDHLGQESFIELDNDKLLSELDTYLYQNMVRDLQKGYYDFLHGAIGYGCYFLKRYQNTKSKKLKDNYVKYLNTLVFYLDKLSVTDTYGLKWSSVIDTTKGTLGSNLSLSHGMSSIINFLSRLFKHLEFRDAVAPLLTGAISYISYFKNMDNSDYYLFPSCIHEPYIPSPSRLAWCYGDLGLGVSLRLAAIALQDSQLYDESISILKHCANRRTKEETLVKDTAICHGAYGNALIFERLYRDTNDYLFKDTALFWMQQGMDMATFKNGLAGHMQWSGNEKGWQNETGFLTGIAGIGMVMIFYLSDFKTSWDQSLMIS
ncbi:lanthionine synthetase C family protein [Aquimarina sp. D1M17]|uniref:lanthionine synthetase C family protein n=1 Tax=Aquimarina acroporae TaxID=2937283 RepID=UPI0020BFF5A8|nr:lanthionine synthetase C family protein [Aquimarina acroporae]MCK8524391.1 lanthionine synthetase C family protein [Aquimarina acroporae]